MFTADQGSSLGTNEAPSGVGVDKSAGLFLLVFWRRVMLRTHDLSSCNLNCACKSRLHVLDDLKFTKIENRESYLQ